MLIRLGDYLYIVDNILSIFYIKMFCRVSHELGLILNYDAPLQSITVFKMATPKRNCYKIKREANQGDAASLTRSMSRKRLQKVHLILLRAIIASAKTLQDHIRPRGPPVPLYRRSPGPR